MDTSEPQAIDGSVRPELEIRTSTRRRKTAAAHLEGGRIVVVAPAHWPRHLRDSVAAELVERISRRRPSVAASDRDLAARAGMLADRYLDGVRPTSVRWVRNQSSRWGSCTTSTGEIRIAHTLRSAPDWVLDFVLVHELAHLLEHGHTARFRSLEDRYPRRREAETFLCGFSLGLGFGRSAAADPHPDLETVPSGRYS